MFTPTESKVSMIASEPSISPDSPVTAPDSRYVVSFVSDSQDHSFLVISKQVEKVNHIIASFGLYGATDAVFFTHIVCCGKVSGVGRIKSEHQYFRENANFDLIGKSFSITSTQAITILNQVKRDAELNQRTRPPRGVEIEAPACFDRAERELFLWFRNRLNANSQGGPRFNGLDFNCHKYALYILRTLEIKDADLESRHFPPGDSDLPTFQPSRLFAVKPEPTQRYPVTYERLFYQNSNPIQGAIALLKDYCNAWFHAKRHYRGVVTNILKKIESNIHNYRNIQLIIKTITDEITPYRYMGGSLQRRLDFLEEQHNLGETSRATRFSSVQAMKKKVDRVVVYRKY